MNIVFAADQNYLPHLETCIKSICRWHKNVNFYVLHDEISIYWFAMMSIKLQPWQSQIHSVHMPENNLAQFKTLKHISKAAYFRFYIAELINVDRALYLDSDLLILQPIDEFYQQDLGDNLLAAINDTYVSQHWLFSYLEKGNYFNSGVMLLDLNKWRELKISQVLLHLAEQLADKVYFGDQCILNILLRDKAQYSDKKFNYQIGYFISMRKTDPNFEIKDVEAANIVHYSSDIKPWGLNYPQELYLTEYWYYRTLDWQQLAEISLL